MAKFLNSILLTVLAVFLFAGEKDLPFRTCPPKPHVATCCFGSAHTPATSHWLNAIHFSPPENPSDSFIQLEDESVWRFSSYDNSKVARWQRYDPIAITQNTRFFGVHTYKLVNKDGSSVEVSLHLGPKNGGDFSRYITSIDFHKGIVFLNDNTYWEICPADTSVFRDWALYDTIITGFNSGGSSSHESLLINVNMNTHLRSTQY